MRVEELDRVPLPDWPVVEAIFQEFLSSGSQWIFRGHSDAKWDLESTLERAVSDLWGDHAKLNDKNPAIRREAIREVLRSGPAGHSMWKTERRVVREFTRQYHQFSLHLPDRGDAMEWLSLMRHHGAPCRLLDFSYSWYVALFFALIHSRREAEVWAIDSDWADNTARSLLPSHLQRLLTEDPQLRRPETADAVLWPATPAATGVIPLNPRRLNPRLVIQQGVFLCPINGSVSFMDNLDAMLQVAGGDARAKVRRFVIPEGSHIRRQLLGGLSRMNMTQATLFPGLDGFAESLTIYLSHAERFGRSTDFDGGTWL
jgi:hypothetical protein